MSRAFRRQRTVLLSRRLWLRRFVFFAGALVVALLGVGFALASDQASDLYSYWTTLLPTWARFIITPLAYAICALAVLKLFPGAQGSGIPQAIAARRSDDETHRTALLGGRVVVGKILLTLTALAAGASVGREGPTVQIGASVMLFAAGFAGLGRQRGLVLAGAGAGIAAAFNTPLAGVLFAIEEMAKAFDKRITGFIIAAVAIAGLVTIMLVGDYDYFGRVSEHLTAPRQWLAVPLCAIVGGLFGGIFSRLVIGITLRQIPLAARLKRRPLLFALGCGLIVAALAYATGDYAAGTGYAPTRALFEGGEAVPWWYPFAKLVTTLLSSVCGIAGGLFSPSLTVGAGFGAVLSPLLPDVPLQIFALLGMVGYFAGVVQAPLTAFVIVIEMTDDSRMVVPVMVTALMAAGLSRLICADPIYHALAAEFERKAPPRPAQDLSLDSRKVLP
ncbi:chloride channel protein [Chelatococcus reniformis]|uniref:Chloride channel protein n=1 Tax=Chelatococcus reniformis TaxID=1494448 RepID=A0A916XMC7_9HYPH|nr:chloride channel protein [Chelatococcus reniformis]